MKLLEEKCFEVCFAGYHRMADAFWKMNATRNIEPVWLPDEKDTLSSFHVSVFGKTAERVMRQILRKYRGTIK